MNEIFLKTIVPLAGGVIALLLLATLLFRRIDRTMPMFVAYMSYYVVEGLASAVIYHYFGRDYAAAYLALCVVDLVFSMSVLVEIGGNVLRSNRISTDGWLRGPAFLFGGCTLLLWSLVRWSNLPRHVSFLLRIDLRLMQASSIISIAAILALLVWSSALKVNWPERELRVMMGMSLLALVSFAVLGLYANGKIGHQYYWLDLLTPISCICVFLYWLHYFWLDASATQAIGHAKAVAPNNATCRPDISERLSVPALVGTTLPARNFLNPGR